jgi:hypothetical protein
LLFGQQNKLADQKPGLQKGLYVIIICGFCDDGGAFEYVEFDDGDMFFLL